MTSMRFLRFLAPTAALGILLAISTFAQTLAAPNLSGTWQMNSNQAETWTIDRNGESIHIRELDGSTVKADYACTLGATECSITDSGHPEKTCLYFNGPRLVELRTRGAEVVKRRFEVSADGQTLQLELIPISHPGKTETVQFKRQQALAKSDSKKENSK